MTSKILNNSHKKFRRIEINPVKQLIPNPYNRKTFQRITSTTFCVNFTTTTAKSTSIRSRMSNFKNLETFTTQ